MDNSNKPLVSVLMPVFNGEKYIWQAIDSILQQTFNDFELVIVNDGSTDQSIKIINSYHDPRIKLYQNDRNRGLSYTRNKCLEYSKGEYIAKLDCDDIALPTRLEDQVMFLNNNKDFGLIGGWVQFIDEADNLGDVCQFEASAEKIPSIMLFHNCFAQSALMFRRNALPEEWYREPFPPAEDYDLWLRIVRKTKVSNLQKVVTYYRLHDSNVSKTKVDAMLAAEQKILLWQLEELGITPSEQEFDIYFSIKKVPSVLSETYLISLRKCIAILQEANEVRKIYNEPFFSNMLSKHWKRVLSIYQDTVFKKKNVYSLHLLKKFYFSPLHHYKTFSTKNIIKFSVKCLIGFTKGKISGSDYISA